MVVTKHAKDRMKERCGYNKKTAKRMADKALHYGLSHKDLIGEVEQWANCLYLSKRKANNIRIYGEQAYLFRNNVLLTVIQVPNRCKNSLALSKEKKRKQKEC